MKKIMVFSVLFCALMTLRNSASAQMGEVKMNLGYNIGMPVGSFKDYMGKNSFRGYFGEVTYGISDRLRIGLGVQTNDYYQKFPRQVYETKDGTISAVLTNSIQTTPILVKANYELTTKAWIRPYVGLGAGFNLISFEQYLGEFTSDSKSAVKPAVSAEGGVTIPFNKITRSSGINLGVHYNYMPFNYSGVDNLNNWGARIGVFFPLG